MALHLSDYDLFLFDFDGLLVNTEELHQKAYAHALNRRGCVLDWDFTTYVLHAHKSPIHLQQMIIQECPQLKNEDYKDFYEEKKSIYQSLLQDGNLSLMPGVEQMLKSVEHKHCAVVTNSTKRQTELIKQWLVPLRVIPLWITREDYNKPKPFPDGYLKALRQLPAGKALGFEDSSKGVRSLVDAQITAVCIKPPLYPRVEGAHYMYESFIELLDHQRK